MNKLAKIGFISLGLLMLPKAFKASSDYLRSHGMKLNVSPEIKPTEEALSIIANLDISNPTDKSMSFSTPLIQLCLKNNFISQDVVSGQAIEIKAQSKTRIPIKIKLSWQQAQELLSVLQPNYPKHATEKEQYNWTAQNYNKILSALSLFLNLTTSSKDINQHIS